MGPVGPGAFLIDPQTDMGVQESHEIEECIDPASVSPTRLALHLAPYQYALPYVAGKEVLEVGCNWGYGSHLLAEEARRVVGFDLNREFVRYGSEHLTRNNVRLMVHDASRPFPFADESFEVVFSSEVIEHVANFSNCIREMQRVLQPEGLLILKTPNLAYARRWHSLNPYHLKVFLPGELQALLDEYFREVQVRGFDEKYEHSLRRVEKRFDPFGIPFEQKIPCPYTIELEAWIEPKLVRTDDSVPQSLLAICRTPRRHPVSAAEKEQPVSV
jgi:SAM-dependent methyltransferase